MELRLSTWRDVEAYLRSSVGVLIPIGSMEQHGPNGLIGTDAICAHAVAMRAGAAAGIMVGPTIELTVAQFNLDFPGTISVRAEVLMRYIQDYLRSLARHGFRRFYFVNGHGANVSVANAAFQDLYAQRSFSAAPQDQPELRCRLRSWWEFEPVLQLRQQWFGQWEGIHATPSEIAITQAVHTEHVRALDEFVPTALAEGMAQELSGDRHYDAQHHRQTYPDGTLGSDPRLASVERGKALLSAAGAAVACDYARFMQAP
jgi:creatinine amidohydrolase